jgi:hypothetical protein
VIAISSYKPFAKSADIARNQLRAKESWEKTFDGIIYFGEPEPELKSPKTQFIPCEPFPPIWLLVLAASQAADHACLINADIVVTPSLRQVWPMPRMSACTSGRYEFDPFTCDYAGAKVKDMGVDFFMASPVVWRACWRAIPKHLRIGHCSWDSWMLSFLNGYCGNRFCDITIYRCIFHPRHEERDRPYHIAPVAYSDLIGLPRSATNTRR